MQLKSYKIKELFNLNRGKESKPKQVKPGITPIITERSVDNGFDKLGLATKVFPKSSITVSVNFGNVAFYQPDSFGASVNVLVLERPNLTENQGLYITTAIKKATQQYTYNHKMSSAILPELDILLPSTTNTYPNHNLIKQLSKQASKQGYAETIRELVCAMSKLDTSTWKEYTLDELFEKIECKKLPYKAKDLYKEPKGDCIGAITATVSNNGIAGYVPKEGATILQNVITVSANGQSGRMFYQPESCTILQDAYALKPKDFDLDEDIALFLIAVMQKLTVEGYDWSNKAGWNKIKHLKVKVPVEEVEEPDYEFMEQYIAQLKSQRLQELKSQRLQELEAYLSITGLDDYNLTEEDIEVLKLNTFKEAINVFKKYKVKELFNLTRGKESKPKQVKPGSTPIITERSIDNGFDKFGLATKTFPKSSITVSVNFGNVVFYQPDSFGASVNVLVLERPDLTENQGLYIATAIKKATQQYTYNHKMSSAILPELDILLPSTTNTYPAIDYMKQIIKSELGPINGSIKGMETYSEIIGKVVYAMSTLDTSTWKEYSLVELFGEPIRGTRLTKENRVKGDIPLITAGFHNNGVAEYISENPNMTLFNNKITIDMFGNVFYRDYEFYADDNILVFGLDNMDIDVGLFLTALISKTVQGYNYSKQFRLKNFKETSIKVPVEEIEEPDFAFMEKYIRAIKKLVVKDLVEWKDKEIEATREIINR